MGKAAGWASALATLLLACGGNTTVTTSSSGSGGTSAGGAGVGGGTGGSGLTAAECLADHNWIVPADYDQYQPVMGSHCVGTNHQDITGVEKLVILGDSISQGTPPTPSDGYYRILLGDRLSQEFPGLEVVECAENGARVDDLLTTQIPQCFPGPEPKKTLVVMTMGGNDMIRWPENNFTLDEANADAQLIAGTLRNAVDWFYEDPSRFPAGVYVVFANVYEFTDGTADLSSCPGAAFINLPAEYNDGAAAVSTLASLYMQVAVETGTDMLLMLENFCGHGWRRADPFVGCYIPDAENWFDLTCIHPSPVGHAALADLFAQVILE